MHDLGCGDELLSGDLIKLGAKGVIAVDKDLTVDARYRSVHPHHKGVTGVRATFEEYAKKTPKIDVAFVSWPVNRVEEGLLTLVSRSKLVIYLGKCTDGACCGWPGLFKHFLSRELIAHVPDEYNSLLAYGRTLPDPRRGENEELGGLDWEKIRPYYNKQGGLNEGT